MIRSDIDINFSSIWNNSNNFLFDHIYPSLNDSSKVLDGHYTDNTD